MKFNYKHTLYAGFAGYIVQSIVNSFVPLLFITFQKSYSLPLSRITLLITINFLIQLVIDLLSTGFIDRIGYRASILLAHGCVIVGFICLVTLPDICPDPFTGILISVAIYAIGGGLIEVLISPIIEACPTKNKEATMSMLHSFYCWGCVGVILFSTLFFTFFGTGHWKILTLLWLIIPTANLLLFTRVPIYSLHEEGQSGLSLLALCRQKIFWLFVLMMICAGASEQAVSQWASAFAETGLGIKKTIGDLVGPMSFSILMGLSRLLYGKWGDRLDLNRCMKLSCVLCILSYLCISLTSLPVLGLIGCGLCGFSVGILWPGTFSRASSMIPRGGTAMFALLALAGDLGCSGGPTLAGFVSSACGSNLRIGILSAIIFPVILLLALLKKPARQN